MLWIEKYKPRSFSEYRYHLKIVSTLNTYTIQTIPHLLIHGSSGHGKKTLIYNLLDKLYDKKITSKLKISSFKTPSNKNVEISYLESPEFIEVTPSEYSYQDKFVIQSLIKNLAQTKPILSLVRNDKIHDIRFIVVNDADDLSRDAQAALRRTVEKYSGNFRIILVCNELNTIIEPIRSRCLCIRVPGFEDSEIKDQISIIVKDEDVKIEYDAVDEIVSVCEGNMRKALCLAENLVTFSYGSSENKRSKSVKSKEKPHLFLEYERIISGVCMQVKKAHDGNNIMAIRKELYTLLNGCIPARIILKEMINRLIKVAGGFEEVKQICDLGTLYDERLKIGSKYIVHLEAFVIAIMSIYL